MIPVTITFVVLIVVGLPIGFVIGIAGLIGIMQIEGPQFAAMSAKRFFAGMNEFTFLAIPFFILAGELMNRSGITARLIELAQALVGHYRAGLAHTNMVASVFFAGLSGVATADSAAFGTTLVPEMKRQGYQGPFSCAVTVAGSIIGPTIPPSNLMVLYGSLMGTSIAGLFAAGILPGLVICFGCMAVIAVLGKRLNLPKSTGRPTLRQLMIAFRRSVLALLMPIIILGGILGGVVTPTEAAAIAVFYSMAVGRFVHRSLTIADMVEACKRTGRVTGVIFLILGAAGILGWWLSFEQIPQAIADGVFSLSKNRHVVLGLVIALLLLFGMVMDIIAVLIILAPILEPVTTSLGLTPVHAGIIFVLALNISLMTPPVGACLFVLSSVTGEPLEQIARAVWPFIFVDIVVLVVLAYWENFALFVPRLLGI